MSEYTLVWHCELVAKPTRGVLIGGVFATLSGFGSTPDEAMGSLLASVAAKQQDLRSALDTLAPRSGATESDLP